PFAFVAERIFAACVGNRVRGNLDDRAEELVGIDLRRRGRVAFGGRGRRRGGGVGAVLVRGIRGERDQQCNGRRQCQEERDSCAVIGKTPGRRHDNLPKWLRHAARGRGSSRGAAGRRRYNV